MASRWISQALAEWTATWQSVQLRAEVGSHLIGRFWRRWLVSGSRCLCEPRVGGHPWPGFAGAARSHPPGARTRFRPLGDNRQLFAGERLLQSECAATTIPAARARELAVSYIPSRRYSHRRRVSPRVGTNVQDRGLSLAGSEVTLYGRFWVTLEGWSRPIIPGGPLTRVPQCLPDSIQPFH